MEERNATISKTVSTRNGYVSFAVCEDLTREKENLIAELVTKFVDEAFEIFNS